MPVGRRVGNAVLRGKQFPDIEIHAIGELYREPFIVFAGAGVEGAILSVKPGDARNRFGESVECDAAAYLKGCKRVIVRVCGCALVDKTRIVDHQRFFNCREVKVNASVCGLGIELVFERNKFSLAICKGYPLFASSAPGQGLNVKHILRNYRISAGKCFRIKLSIGFIGNIKYPETIKAKGRIIEIRNHK